MRAAPAVSADIGLSTAWRAVQALLWALAAASLTAWLLGGLASPGPLLAAYPLVVFAGLPATLLVAVVAWWRLGRGPHARSASLQWNGEQWLLDGQAVRVTVALDFGRWLLLSFQPTSAAGSCRWLPATERQAGAHWHVLRAALYSRAPEATLAAAPPPGASAPD